MSPSAQIPHWEWWLVALDFFVVGIAGGTYFIGSLVELFGKEKHREISRIAYYITLPLMVLPPILLIADLGQPGRFWHLFWYSNESRPYLNPSSPLSIGSWALLVFAGMAFLSFLDNLVADGKLKFAPFANLYNRRPRKIYALVGAIAGFFIAAYTGVLVNTTAVPLWAATDPLFGPLFMVSSAAMGAAAIALVMAVRKMASGEAYEQLANFGNLAMILQLLLLIGMVFLVTSAQSVAQAANPKFPNFTAPLLSGEYALWFWGGVVLLGTLVPLGVNWYSKRQGEAANQSLALVMAVLIILGGFFLRFVIVQAGQVT